MAVEQGRSAFLEEVRAAIRVRHYSIRTERAYLGWVRRFIVFHGKRHPREMGEAEVGSLLTYLAVERRVAAATQNLALNALILLYRRVQEQLGHADVRTTQVYTHVLERGGRLYAVRWVRCRATLIELSPEPVRLKVVLIAGCASMRRVSVGYRRR